MPNGPVASYLAQLRRELPYPAPRLIAEAREHLLEATAASVATGLSEHDAEARAIESYGSVSEVVSAVLQQGSAMMSPRVARLLVLFSVLLTVPTLVFIFVNVIERLAGSEGSEGVFGSALDAWTSQINALLVFGPLVAVILITITSLRVHRDRGVDGFGATIELRMSRVTFRAALVVFLIAAAVLGYGLAENFGTWMK